ncbi:hypothetical protein LWI29_023040 [Acer saccharum]|uniref:Uncharacterized protein n=1 Tax=Acer saccharum TaxID=4024 RepID=A0AA39SV85_ACESA|nr:hypothetical protein LWI29_023040 [Acer saccharum]
MFFIYRVESSLCTLIKHLQCSQSKGDDGGAAIEMKNDIRKRKLKMKTLMLKKLKEKEGLFMMGARILKDDYYISKQKKLELKLELEWGKGLAQKQEAQARLEELELEKDKPFARTRDDPELDKMLRQRLRWGDPMAHLVKNKHYEPILPELGDNEKMKESRFVIPQDIKKRIRCFTKSIWYFTPGRHWDGVDRSTTGWFTSLFHS